jgi:putative FmdB family regulatory protein
MARYLFKCEVCGVVFEKNIPIYDDKEEITCPNGHRGVQRIYTSPHIVFKGPGFYINDSKPKSDTQRVKPEK